MKYVIGVVTCVACFLVCLESRALDVDMDPVPRIPLRKDDTQVFLVHLSKAAKPCRGTVSFEKLPAGLEAAPRKQEFSLAPGASKLLVFTIKNTVWGKPAVVRPEVVVDGGEPVNFPEALKTTIVRARKFVMQPYNVRASLDTKPLDEKGLLVYYSCGGGNKGVELDKSVGFSKMWNEGLWYHDGGVKGRCVYGMHGRPYPRHRWSKMAYETLSNLCHKRGTILFWMRKSLRPTEIPYAGRFKRDFDPATTWKLGPTAAGACWTSGSTPFASTASAWAAPAGSDETRSCSPPLRTWQRPQARRTQSRRICR